VGNKNTFNTWTHGILANESQTKAMINNCFMAITQFNLCYPAAPTRKNWRILLEQNFAACMPLPMAAAWHSCNIIGRIKEVTLRWARLVVG